MTKREAKKKVLQSVATITHALRATEIWLDYPDKDIDLLEECVRELAEELFRRAERTPRR